MISKYANPVNEFPESLKYDLLEALEKAARQKDRPLVAAFDADGTLWDTDIGESFFDFQINKCGLSDLPADPWTHYRDLKKVDHIAAYVWLAQINKGQTLKQVRDWAEQAVAERSELPIFQSQRDLINEMKRMGYKVYVVTASVKWAVEPAARRLGIDENHVLGITTRTENGIVGTDAVLPITWRQGKADALMQATGGVPPVFCSGNTYGDIALLRLASVDRLAVSTQSERNGLFEEEAKLREEARSQGWRIHAFRPLSEE